MTQKEKYIKAIQALMMCKNSAKRIIDSAKDYDSKYPINDASSIINICDSIINLK